MFFRRFIDAITYLCRESPMVLVIPFLGWFVLGVPLMLLSEAYFFHPMTFGLLFVGSVAGALVHFLGYLIFGIPLMMRLYSSSSFWHIRSVWHVLMGIMIGAAASLLMFVDNWKSVLIFALIASIYGGWTSYWLVQVRRRELMVSEVEG